MPYPETLSGKESLENLPDSIGMDVWFPGAVSQPLTGLGFAVRTAPELQKPRGCRSNFGPQKNMLWKTALPPGYSSLALAGNRIFVTAFEGEKSSSPCA